MIGSTLGLKVHLLCFLIRRPFFFSTSCYFNVVAILFLFFFVIAKSHLQRLKEFIPIIILAKKNMKEYTRKTGEQMDHAKFESSFFNYIWKLKLLFFESIMNFVITFFMALYGYKHSKVDQTSAPVYESRGCLAQTPINSSNMLFKLIIFHDDLHC